jgi:prepilin-type N-terminal cleavage/methylation domain-containing protein
MTFVRNQYPTCSRHPHHARGFTLIETVVAMVVATMLLVSLGGVVTNTLTAHDVSRERNDLARDARFALRRMTEHVQDTTRLLVPLVNSTKTAHNESFFDPGVLAVTLPPQIDRDANGIADADNDGDGLIDEDLGQDTSNDNKPGLIGIDDDNNGEADSSFLHVSDDDESWTFLNEDPFNGLDDDGDGSIDEDAGADMNGDGQPGIALVDDDNDGSVDEGGQDDDDEDGLSNEDWLDAVVYHQSGSNLIERFPNLNPSSGTDFTERTIAENVSLFQVELLPRGVNRVDLVRITLELTDASNSISVVQRVRVGGPP